MQEDELQLSNIDKALNSFPEEIEELFLYLLKSLGNTARKRAFQVFEMVSKMKEVTIHETLPLVAYSFLPELERQDICGPRVFSILQSGPGSKTSKGKRAQSLLTVTAEA